MAQALAILKQCSKCKNFKDKGNFSLRSSAPDGLFYDCRDCQKLYREANKKYISGRRKQHYIENRERIISRVKKYRSSDQGRKNKSKTNKVYYEKYPEKIRATRAINNGIRDKKVFKPETCEECGLKAKVQGHHDDYSKPLEVRWLCEPCHTHHHTKVNRA